MTSQTQILCSECATSLRQDVPFCPQCGKMPPYVVSKGAVSLELGDVPSQNTRAELLRVLKSWFPDLDAGRAESRLKNGPGVLIAGIDEESGARLADALKSMKIQARLVDDRAESWGKRLWNSGLVVSAISLMFAAMFGGPVAFVFILIAGGAPLAAALLVGNRRKPLVMETGPVFSAEQWTRLSQDYSQVIKSLAPADATTLRSLVTRIFDLQARLRSASLASVAAGAETGDLYKRLRDAVGSGIHIGDGIASSEGESQKRSREELVALGDQVTKIDNWFRSLEDEGTRHTAQLSEDLNEITAGIDRIVREVRPPQGSSSPAEISMDKVRQ